ncbi:MAG: LysE family transporter, partial [Rhodobacterales bacterium]|nr:LysE family transporter [Rhodobacterales bacterium]
VYGWGRFRAALRGGAALLPAAGQGAALGPTLATCLTLTWANPHVYLDTLVLVGSVATRYDPHRAAFGLGAMLASGMFFSALGFGARLLAPMFARPRAWVVLEAAVGLLMWAIAAKLALG